MGGTLRNRAFGGPILAHFPNWSFGAIDWDGEKWAPRDDAQVFRCRPRLLRPVPIKAYNRTIVKQSVLNFEQSYPKAEATQNLSA
jgi:hypothetical protein